MISWNMVVDYNVVGKHNHVFIPIRGELLFMHIHKPIHTTFALNIHHFPGVVRDYGLRWVGHVMNWLKALCHHFFWVHMHTLVNPTRVHMTSLHHITSYHVLDIKVEDPIAPMTQSGWGIRQRKAIELSLDLSYNNDAYYGGVSIIMPTMQLLDVLLI